MFNSKSLDNRVSIFTEYVLWMEKQIIFLISSCEIYMQVAYLKNIKMNGIISYSYLCLYICFPLSL